MTFDTFEDGVFRSETPVSCPDHPREHLRVAQLSAQAEWEATREQRLAPLKRFKEGLRQ